MSKSFMKFPSGHFLNPIQIKSLIQSVQKVCVAKNIDLRTSGNAKTQHIMAEALGCKNWQHLLNYCSTPKNGSNETKSQEITHRAGFGLMEEEQSLLMNSSTGRWAIDEVALFAECLEWLKIAEGFACRVFEHQVELAWDLTEKIPNEELPDMPSEMELKSLEMTPTGVHLEIGEDPRFTLVLAISTCEELRACRPLFEAIEASHGILTLNTWTRYSIALPKGDRLDCVFKAYERDIAKAFELAEEW